MPYQVQQLVQGKAPPVSVVREDSVEMALTLMMQNDYSQLPVVEQQQGLDIAQGMITYEGILRGIRNFGLGIAALKVRDVMTAVPQFTLEDDLFDILDKLKETNAVLITGTVVPELVGIVTSYDATEYFRERTEDLMHVEDIEVTIKDLIKEAYLDDAGELDSARLMNAARRVIHRANPAPIQEFDDLTLGEYGELLTLEESWPFFDNVFHLPRAAVKDLISGVRRIRNSLAHFRANLTPEERDKLRFTVEWLARCQESFQYWKYQQYIARIAASEGEGSTARPISESEEAVEIETVGGPAPSEFAVTDSAAGGGKYGILADWLQSQPGKTGRVQLTLNQIEEIIGSDLPPSARTHRAWWANDSVSHPQSQLWLDAGWRTSSINLTEGRVTFNRIRDRESAYIAFFAKLLGDLRKIKSFPFREVSPDGASWIVVQPVPRQPPALGSFAFAFTRDRRLRVELYIDLLDKTQTKCAFDKLYAHREEFEASLGVIQWERLDNRRASRLALYREGHIEDTSLHNDLRQWAATAMASFFKALVESAEGAIVSCKSADEK